MIRSCFAFSLFLVSGVKYIKAALLSSCMKKHNLIGIVFLLSFLLALSGCGKDSEPVPVPAEEVVDDASDDGADEPELPEDAPQDVGDDITESELDDEEEPEDMDETDDGAGEAADEGDGADGADDADDDAGESADDGSDGEGEELTAENYRVISLKDLKAYPEEMTVPVGTTVEWRNVNDNLQHIIGWRGQTGMGVKPEPILQGESWSYTFVEPGEIKWFSTARPTIQGTIIVEVDEE